MLALETLFADKAAKTARFLDRHFSARQILKAVNHGLPHAHTALPRGLDRLLESLRYSLLQEGGKRFRPALAMMTAEALGFSSERVLPFAAAVECVHTYSLIHDDLPAMDDDDYRRGQPTNHKVFGDSTAILAGDALLTEAFQILTTHYRLEPSACIHAFEELSTASGLYGMVGGQAIDMRSKDEPLSLKELETMHLMKTGALIRASAVGAAHLCFASNERLNQVRQFSQCLGLAFQVADDILDFVPAEIEPGSYPALLGLPETQKHLAGLTENCLQAIESWGSAAEPLRELARYNRQRTR